MKNFSIKNEMKDFTPKYLFRKLKKEVGDTIRQEVFNSTINQFIDIDIDTGVDKILRGYLIAQQYLHNCQAPPEDVFNSSFQWRFHR